MPATFSTPAVLQLNLLGGCEIHCKDSHLHLESNKVRAMLVYLAMNPGYHERNQLMGFFWADFPEERARRNLRHTLWNLRSRLDHLCNEPFLKAEGEAIAFNHDNSYRLDVELFRQATSELKTRTISASQIQNLQKAIDLYRGDFLQGFHVSKAIAFEEWALAERTQLQALARQILENLAQIYVHQGNYEAARSNLERLVTLEPWDEQTHRQLMCLMVLLTERNAALNQYKICRTTLKVELDVEPLEETTILYESIQNGSLGREKALALLVTASSRQVKLQVANNLPAQTTSFFGREKDQEAILNLLHEPGCRLLTLHGPPGVGKTRLSLETVERLVDEQPVIFPDGIYFISLAPLTSASEILSTVIEALPDKPYGREPMEEWLQRYLKERQLLLILDNYEHLLEAATFVSDLLAACPLIKVLVTSREILHLRGEHNYPLQPLPLPETFQAHRWDALKSCPPVALFTDRARTVQHGFQLNPENTSQVLEICRKLDGLPLAIELAAARIKVLSPSQLLDQLTNREQGAGLELLASSLRDQPERHQAFNTAIRWSYELLDNFEKELFSRLAVFSGGCTLESARAICTWEGCSTADLLAGLNSLIDRSLLYLRTAQSAEKRYGMLVIIRQFAMERLAANSQLTAVQDLFAEYFLNLVESAEEGLKGGQQMAWIFRLEDELGNLRAIYNRALEHKQVTIALRLGGALARFWQRHGGVSEGRRWLREALAMPGSSEAPESILAKTLWAAGLLAWYQRDLDEARNQLEASLALCRSRGDTAGVARALNDLGSLATGSTNYDLAQQLLSESRALYEQIQDRWGMATALSNLGMTIASQGKVEEAADLMEQSLALRREIEDITGVAYDLSNLGLANRYLGNLERAAALYRESLNLLAILGHKTVRTAVLSNLADLERSRGRFEQAWGSYAEGLKTSHETGEKESFAVTLEGLGRVAVEMGKEHLAARLLGAASALRQEIGIPLPDYRKQTYTEIIEKIRTGLGETKLKTAMSEGSYLSLDEIFTLANEN